jgi:FkbM family methyltransferase
MKKLSNGWLVPDGDTKMTSHIADDPSPENPLYELRHRQIILDNLPKKGVFVDVGANIGVWSIPMLSKFNRVISYEPSIRNRECLELNLRGRGEVRPYAVGDAPGEVSFLDAIKNCGNSRVWADETAEGSYKVQIVKLDDQGIENCSLIKIDTQGFELQVIYGARKIIEEQKPWIAFEVSEDVDVICKFLEERGYDMIKNKSKRIFIFAPKTGPLSPKEEAFGRAIGLGPYIRLLPEDKQEIAKKRYNQ